MRHFIRLLMLSLVLIFIAWLPIYFLKIDGYNFWSDYTGYIGILDIPSKYLFTIQENFFGSFRYLFNSSVLLLFQWIVFTLASPQYGTYIIIFSINLLVVIAGYNLSKSYLQTTKWSVLFSLLFIYNPVYLYALYVNLTLGFLLPIAGLLLFFLFFSKYYSTQRRVYFLVLPLTSLLIIHPFMFFFYLFFSVALFLNSKKYRDLFLFLGLTLLVNLFWIVPFLIGMAKQTFAPSVLSGSVVTKDVLESYVGYASTLNFMIRGDSFQKTLYGAFYPVVSLIWLVLLYVLIHAKKKHTWLLIPLFCCIVFSWGGTGVFGSVFNFFWDHFSFFHFFRSFTNVLYLAWYYVLFLILLHAKDSLRKENFSKLLLVTIFLMVVPIFIVNKSATFGATVQIPKDYFILQKFINTQKDDYYIFRLPYSMYEYYSWDTSKRDKYFFEDFFNKGVVYNAIGMSTFDSKTNLIGALYRHVYEGKDIRALGAYGIKYVLVSKDLTHINERYYLQLNAVKLQTLKRVFTSEYMDLYEIPGHREKLQSQNISYRKYNPTTYDIVFDKLKGKQKLILLAAYDPDWVLLAQKKEQEKDVEVFTASHTQYQTWGNQWIIDPDTVKKTAGFEYSQNSDNTIRLHLKLVYKKQDLVDKSFAFSSLVICILAILCSLEIIRNRYDAHKH